MLNKFFAILLLASVAIAWDIDADPNAGYYQPPPGQTNATITLTSVNDYTLSGISSPRALDYADTHDVLLMSDYSTDSIYFLNPSTGTINNAIAAPPEIPQVLGVAYQWNAADEIFINDWDSGHDIWKHNGGSWAYAFANPVPAEPRGIAIDDSDYIWGQDASDRQLYRFDQTGGNVTVWSMPDCPSAYSCGITLFPFGANQGIVLSGYSWGELYFYEYDGANVTFLGSALVPYGCTASYGLAYSSSSDSFFWLRRNNTVYSICEFTAVIETPLQRDTWGGIKAAF